MKFSIITCTRNNEKWLKNNIDSVKNQTYKNYEHIIIDDASTDKSLEVIKENIDPQNTKVFVRQERVYTTKNHILGLKQMTGDVVVHLDGDDWLYNEYVLQKLFAIYKETDCWATYGSWIHRDSANTWIIPPHPTHKAEDVRGKKTWCFTHLRSFRKHLISAIPVMDSFDPNGNVHIFASDLTLLTGVYEYALLHNKVQYIKDPMVVYNSHTGNNEHLVNLPLQASVANQVYNSPYSVLKLL